MSINVPVSLFDAMAQQLLGNAPLVAAFGDNSAALATTKLWAENVQATVQLPWAAYHEAEEERTPTSRDGNGLVNYFCRGRFTWTVTSSDKANARYLSDLIANALDDAPLTFEDGTLLELTWENSTGGDVTTPQTGAVVAYARTVHFVYMVQRISAAPPQPTG